MAKATARDGLRRASQLVSHLDHLGPEDGSGHGLHEVGPDAAGGDEGDPQRSTMPPLVDPQIVLSGDRPDPRVADEDVELAEALARSGHEGGEVIAAGHVGGVGKGLGRPSRTSSRPVVR